MTKVTQYTEMTREEVLILQEALYKVPGIWQSSVTSLIGVILVLLLLFVGSTSLLNLSAIAVIGLLIVIVLFVLLYKSNWKKRRRIKLDLLHREKKPEVLKIRSKMCYNQTNVFVIYIFGREQPLLVEETFYNSVKKMEAFPIWRSRFGDVLLTKKIKSKEGYSVDLDQIIPFQTRQELMI